MTEAREDLVRFIQEGNGTREKLIILLDNLQAFKFELFRSNRKWLGQLDQRFSDLYRTFLDFDKRAGLFSETLAMAITIDKNGKFVRLPTLDEYNLLSIYASHLSAHRETLRNLLRDIENRISNHREILNNRAIRLFSWISLFVAVVSILLTIVNDWSIWWF